MSDIDVKILTMKLSDGREEYYVQISCDGRETKSMNKYAQGYINRAHWEVDELRHVLLGEPEPNLMNPKYRDQPTS